METITTKELHDKTGLMVARARRGESLQVLKHGRPSALLVPVAKPQDPSWSEIMADVDRLRGTDGPPLPNPVLAARRRRNYAARLR